LDQKYCHVRHPGRSIGKQDLRVSHLGSIRQAGENAVRRVVVGLAILAAGATAASADPASSTYQVDPTHDGLVTFSKPFAPPLKQRWSVSTKGGISYPVVSGDLVVVLLTTGKVSSLAAYAIGTGKRAWLKPLPGVLESEEYLASDAGSIFVATRDKPMQAFNAADGKALWISKKVQSFGSILPVAADGIVYGGGDGTGTNLLALDEKTGAIKWTVLEDGGGLGPTLGGGKVYFPAPCDVPAYVPTSGRKLWDYNLECDGGGGAIAAFYAGRLYAPDISNQTSGVIIETSTGALLGGLAGRAMPAFGQGKMYAISGTAIVASDLSTGNLHWYFAPADSFTIPPIVINGNVYSLSEKGVLYINAGADGKLLQSIKVCSSAVNGGLLRGLGAAHNTLLVPCGHTLVAFAP
jgi:outer membrane protein assembly factor BamB